MPPIFRPPRIKLVLAVVGVALGFSLLESLQGRLQYARIPAREFWPEAVWRTLPSWLILAALIPALAFCARAARVGRDTWRTALPLQFLAGVIFTVIHLGGTAWAASLRHHGSVESYFVPMFGRYAVLDLFTYGAIVAGLHAYDYQAEARERAMLASQLQAGMASMRLQVLEAQLEPHFLFNALNSISSLALSGEREQVAQAVSNLSELLRRSLDESGEHQVPLATELELLECYLDLERVRFGDRIAFERQVDPAALAARVPSLMLQTLVENAVRHGLEARRGPGRLVVEITREDANLRIEVRDSGPGFDPALVTSGNGIGLRNTEARLEQLYGGAARLERGVAPEGGARVTVTLPFNVAAPARVAGTVA